MLLTNHHTLTLRITPSPYLTGQAFYNALSIDLSQPVCRLLTELSPYHPLSSPPLPLACRVVSLSSSDELSYHAIVKQHKRDRLENDPADRLSLSTRIDPNPSNSHFGFAESYHVQWIGGIHVGQLRLFPFLSCCWAGGIRISGLLSWHGYKAREDTCTHHNRRMQCNATQLTNSNPKTAPNR